MDDIEELYGLFPEIKEHILVEKKVGQGTFSYVYMGYFRKDTSEKVALKYIIPTSAPWRTKHEIECLLNMGGKDNVIDVLAVLRNKSHILILMPYIEHESFHESFIYWSQDEVKEYIKNLLIALNRIHQSGIIHRDVKPSNFLYDRKKKLYALVDFGLAQAYDKSSENIFVYEKLSKTKSSTKTENSPLKKNLIAISSSKRSSLYNNNNTSNNSNNSNSTSSHLILTNSTKSQLNQSKAEINSLPHAPSKESFLSNSQSFDSNLSDAAISKGALVQRTPSPVAANRQSLLTSNKNTPNIANLKSGINSPKVKTPNSSTFQKFYSFQKSSFSMNENKCACFNTQFVCEICTARNNKWAPRAGTAGFRAPEILFRSNFQTSAIDVWSAGVILLSILSGRYPFFKAVDDNMAIMQLVSLFGVETVRKNALKYGESFICSYEKKSTDLKEICVTLRRNTLKSMSTNKTKRKSEPTTPIDMSSIVCEFSDSAYDLLKKLLDFDCDKRLSAECALNHPFFNNNN